MPVELPDAEKLELIRDLKRMVELKKHNGLASYAPHEKQALFHSAGDYKLRYLRTGNRFGKSTCGAAEDCAWALGERLWLPKDHPDRQKGIPRRSTKGLILVADWDKAREIFTSPVDGEGRGKLYKLLPTASLKRTPHKNQAGEIDCILVESVWGGTSSIYIDTVKSYMSNPMGQESSDWDWIHVDEPIPEQMWKANSRGLMDSNGSAWFTCTPIAEQWINEMFIPLRDMRRDFTLPQTGKRHTMWVMTGTSYDNTSIGKEGIDNYVAQLNPGEVASRIFGHPKSFAGSIYGPFVDRAFHEYSDVPYGWIDHNTPPDNYTIRVSIDPHPSTPTAAVFAATAPTGQTFFWAHYWNPGLMETHADGILDLLGGRTPQVALCDPSAFNIDPLTGTTWADLFWAKGLYVIPASKELTHGIVVTQQALAQRTGQTLHFSSALERIWYEFDAYIWDPKKENKPLDKNDHMMECLYRLVINGLDYIDPRADESVDLRQPIILDGDKTIEMFAQDRAWMKSLTRDAA